MNDSSRDKHGELKAALDELERLAIVQAGTACWKAIEKHMPLLRSFVRPSTGTHWPSLEYAKANFTFTELWDHGRKQAVRSSTRQMDRNTRDLAEGILEGDDNPTAAKIVAKAFLSATGQQDEEIGPSSR